MYLFVSFLSFIQLSLAQQSFTIRSERLILPHELSTSAVSVINGNDSIEGQEFMDNLESLSPGVFASNSGTFGAQSSLSLRGAGRGFSQTNFAGLRLRDASDIDQSFQNQMLPNSFVGSMEVMRGIQSGLYGSDAIGGVVSIQAPEKKSNLNFKAGSYNQMGLAAQARLEKTKILFDYQKADGPSAFNQAKTDYAEKDSWRSLNGYLEHQEKWQQHQFFFQGLFLQNTKEIDGGFPFSDMRDNDSSQQTHFTLGAGVRSLSRGPLKYEFKWQTSDVKRDVLATNYQGQSDEVSVEGSYLFSKFLSALVFLESIQDEAQIEGDFEHKKSENYALGFTIHQNFSRSFFSQTLRLDHHSRFDAHTTYKLGAGVYLSPLTILRASYATGFKAPTLYQLYTNLGGDSNLKPSKARGFDVGLSQKLGHGSVEINYFETKIDSQIDYDLDNSRYLNIAKTSQRGVELSFDQRFKESFKLGVKATRLWAINELTGAKLLLKPDLSVHVKMSYLIARAHEIGIIQHYQGKQQDSVGELPPFYTIALSGSHQLGSELRAYWLVRNLLNRQYEDVRDYGTLERSFVVGVKRELE